MSPAKIVRPALARIVAPGDGYALDGDRYWGTGFFVAPGWLLTCAHVVGKGGGPVWRSEDGVGVAWQGGISTGEVVLAKPRPAPPEETLRHWDFPDIALIRVADARDADCAALSERAPSVPAEVSLHGWSTETGQLGVRDGYGHASAYDAQALVLTGILPTDGMSGGPVIDRRQGTVIGLLKGRGEREGAAVPITALRELYELRGGRVLHSVMREHDRYHSRRLADPALVSWARFQARLRDSEAAGLDPVLRARLYGGLAELPSPGGPGDVMALVEEVERLLLPHERRSHIRMAGDFGSSVEHDPRTWAEGAGLLHGLRESQGGGAGSAGPGLDTDAVLLYTAKVIEYTAPAADPEAVRDLADWIGVQAESRHVIHAEITAIRDALREPHRTGHSIAHARVVQPRADVRVVVDEPRYGSLYPWRIELLVDGAEVRLLTADDHGVRGEDLPAALRKPLAEALSQGDRGTHLAAVEALLPRQLFDIPLDTWQLGPQDPQGVRGSGGSEGAPMEGSGGLDGSSGGSFYDERSMPLGMRRTVIIRDVRRNGREASPEWRRLWNAAELGPLSAVPLRREAEAAGHAHGVRRERPHAVYFRLSNVPGGSVPVYCGPVGSGDGFEAMAAALAAGHPLALWRRSGQEHSDCGEFHRRADQLLREVGRADDALLRRIRELRGQAADPDPEPETEAEVGWARSLAVLFDQPDRPPYGGEGLSPPPLASP